MPDLSASAQVVLGRCLAVKAGEEVLVIVDPNTRAVGEALQAEASRLGADAVLALIEERADHGTEPPATLAAAMRHVDVFVAATTKSLSHTRARTEANERGARGATMPGVTAEMLARVMAVDFDVMAARSKAVARLLTEASEARVRCPRGTDMRLDLTGREGHADDGDITRRGAFGNLPCGEGYIAPMGGEGTIAASSLAQIGLSREPAVLTVERGAITAATGGRGPEYLERLSTHGDPGRNLAELGVGTNDRATLTGSMLEDEKMLGTVHIAFGASAGIGGTVSVPIHLDVVVLDASLEVGGRRVLEGGRWALDGA